MAIHDSLSETKNLIREEGEGKLGDARARAERSHAEQNLGVNRSKKEDGLVGLHFLLRLNKF